MVVPSTGAPTHHKTTEGVKRQRHRPESCSVLDLWLQQHNNNLYPSKDEKDRLVKATQLNYNQVSRWFANRRRKLKLRNCLSPTSSSGGQERNSSSPAAPTGEFPGISPQAPNCPGNASVWNDGSNITGGTDPSGVIQSIADDKLVDSNNNPDMVPNSHLPQRHQPALPPIGECNLLTGQNLFHPQDLMPTPPALVPGIYPPLSGRNPFAVPPFGLSSGMDLGPTNGMLNPYFLSALASGAIHCPPTSNPWMSGNGFLPSFFTNPLLSPPETVASEKQKTIEEEESETGAADAAEDTVLAETERLLMDLTEKESIAVSVLAEFALQRKQRDEISVRA